MLTFVASRNIWQIKLSSWIISIILHEIVLAISWRPKKLIY